jgi:membrane fusion protein (multidrug efflux system)
MPNSSPENDDCGTLLDLQEPPARVEHEADSSQADNSKGKDLGKASGARRKKMLLFPIAVVVAVVGAYFVWNAFRYENTDDAQVDGHIMPLSARITGHVEKVNFIEGQIVHAGGVLVVIDPSDYQVAADQAVANLANAEATSASSHYNIPITSASAYSSLDSAQAAVTNAQAGVKAAKHNLEANQAGLVQARANAAKTDSDLIRYEQLVQKEDISRQQYDGAVAAAQANRAAVTSGEAVVAAAEQALDQAHAKLLQAKADLRNAQTAPQQVSLTDARARAADAQILQTRAQLAQARLNLSYTIIRSPVTGIVGRKSVEVGQNVSVGQELLEEVPLDDIWVTANFKETQLKHMRPGQAVEVKVDAYGRSWKGHVTNLGGGTGSVFSLLPPENATGNYVKVVQRVPVRIDFDRSQMQDFNAEGLLKPGLSVEPDVRAR